MAELPRYRRAGVLTANLPSVDFASVREGARTAAFLSDKLDRMANFAFGEAAELAKVEGLQYGAENPVTATQLREAIAEGRNPGELFQNRGTIFGDAARSAQVLAVTSELEMDAQARLNELRIGVEQGTVELDDARQQIGALIDGYGKSLVQVDPRASGKLRAAIGTAANSAYLSMTRDWIKRQGELRKTAIDSWLANTVPGQVEAHIQAGDTIDPDIANAGVRPDGTAKGAGFFGKLKTADGKIATELSISVEIDGKEILMPLLVPTLTQSEITHLLAGKEPTKQIIDKAVAHAERRIEQGKSPFADDNRASGIITPQQRIDATLRAALMNQVAAIGDPEFGRQAIKRFDDIVNRAKVNALAKYVAQPEFMRDTLGTLERIRAGDLGPLSSVYKSMPADEQEKVRKNFMEEAGRLYTLTQRTVQEDERQKKQEVYGLLARYWSMPDGFAKQALQREIVTKGNGVLSVDQLKSLMKPAGEGKADVMAEIHAIDLVRRGGVTDLADLQRRAPGLKAPQLKRLQDMIYDTGDRQLREGVRMLAGIPDGLVQLTGDQQRRFNAYTQEVDRLKADAISKTGTYDPAVIMGQLREKKESIARDKEADAAKNALAGYGQRKGGNITETTSEAELRRLKFSELEIREIQRHQRTIRGDQ